MRQMNCVKNLRRFMLLGIFLASSVLMTGVAWSQDGLEFLNKLMALSQDAVADKSLGFFSAGADLVVSHEELISAQLAVQVFNEGGGDLIEGEIDWSLDGVQWKQAKFDPDEVTSGKVLVSLPLIPMSGDLQSLVIRTRLRTEAGIHENRQLVVVLPPGERKEVSFYDIGGTLQAKNKLAEKKAKDQRDPFGPVIKAIMEDIKAKRLVVYLTGKEQASGYMIRKWFRKHGLPPGPVLMPERCLTDNEKADFKLDRLESLKTKAHVVSAWGNGVEKDILPFMKASICTVNHISWPLSDVSSIKLLLERKLLNYRLQSRIKLAHCADGTCFPAVLSTYIVEDPPCKDLAAQGAVSTTDSPPDDDSDSPPCFHYPDIISDAVGIMQQQFDDWVQGLGLSIPQLWQGLTATVLFFTEVSSSSLRCQGQ